MNLKDFANWMAKNFSLIKGETYYPKSTGKYYQTNIEGQKKYSLDEIIELYKKEE